MHALYERWQETPSIDNALDMLDCSSFVSENGLFYGPAAQIINSDEVTKTSKFVAQKVVRPERHALSPTFEFSSRDLIFKAIGENRQRLRNETRNSLLHSEQARLYAIIDETSSAERAFHTALSISPDNRHILRSFARFMVHVGSPETALRRLRQCPAIGTDPWVQAAEIAISEHHGVGSSVAKSATRRLEASQIQRDHISELATALATLERSSGNRKKFRKRFSESLIQPSDNALAQATWFMREAKTEISEEFSDFLFPAVHLSNEARTYTFLKKHMWREAVEGFTEWQKEESFSSHIAIQGSFYAVSLAKDYKSAISICRNGLIANTTSHGLLNNLCYAERRSGLINDAKETMEKLKSVYPAWRISAVYLATDGMLNFAVGDHDSGRVRYREALEIAEAANEEPLCQRIKMHWLHEEALSGTITHEESARLISIVDEAMKIGDSVSEIGEYWRNIRTEIVHSCAKSGNLHLEQRDDPHVLEHFL